jgi:hypothetical protein
MQGFVRQTYAFHKVAKVHVHRIQENLQTKLTKQALQSQGQQPQIRKVQAPIAREKQIGLELLQSVRAASLCVRPPLQLHPLRIPEKM